MSWFTVRLQVFEKCAMNAAAEVPLELCDPNSAICAFIRQRNEPAPLLFFHGHFRHDRDSDPGGHHRHNGRELTTLKRYIGMKPGATACGERVFAEAVAFF